MGNTGGTVSSGVKAQAAGNTKELYNYINLGGGGKLVDLMKTAKRTKDYSAVDKVIKVCALFWVFFVLFCFFVFLLLCFLFFIF